MGKVQTGNWPSTVPETLVAEGRYGIEVDEDIESAQKEFTDALDTIVQADPWLSPRTGTRRVAHPFLKGLHMALI
jgi:acetylornithine deacetylase